MQKRAVNEEIFFVADTCTNSVSS